MNKNKGVIFDLQLFGNSEAATVGASENLEGQQENMEEVTYTQEEFEKKLQSEADKRVTEALKTNQEKWKKEYEENLKKEKDEAARLARLSADERAKAELEKEKEKFESDRKAFERERLELQVRKNLGAEGLNENFASFLIGKDADESMKNIKDFKDTWDKALEFAVKEQLKGEAPEAASSVGKSDPFLKGMGLI